MRQITWKLSRLSIIEFIDRKLQARGIFSTVELDIIRAIPSAALLPEQRERLLRKALEIIDGNRKPRSNGPSIYRTDEVNHSAIIRAERTPGSGRTDQRLSRSIWVRA
jgi:hypothetical protein